MRSGDDGKKEGVTTGKKRKTETVWEKKNDREQGKKKKTKRGWVCLRMYFRVKKREKKAKQGKIMPEKEKGT